MILCWKDYVIDAHEHRVGMNYLIELRKILHEALHTSNNAMICGGYFKTLNNDIGRKLNIVDMVIRHYYEKFTHNGKNYDFSRGEHNEDINR